MFPHPQTHYLGHAYYRQSYPGTVQSNNSNGLHNKQSNVPHYSPVSPMPQMYPYPWGVAPWYDPQNQYYYNTFNPIMPPNDAPYQNINSYGENMIENRKWDSPESPQSPWIQAYNQMEKKD